MTQPWRGRGWCQSVARDRWDSGPKQRQKAGICPLPGTRVRYRFFIQLPSCCFAACLCIRPLKLTAAFDVRSSGKQHRVPASDILFSIFRFLPANTICSLAGVSGFLSALSASRSTMLSVVSSPVGRGRPPVKVPRHEAKPKETGKVTFDEIPVSCEP